MKIYKKICVYCETVIVYRHKNKPEKCDFCRRMYWDKPEDERALFLIQAKYMVNKEENYFIEMYQHLVKYSRNIILNKIKNKFIMAEELLEEKSNDLAVLFLEKYLKDPDFQINQSFGGRLKRFAKGVLYGKKREEQHSSLNQEIKESHTEFLNQIQKHIGTHRVDDVESRVLSKDTSVVDITFSKIQYITDYVRKNVSGVHSILLLAGIKNRVKKKGDKFMDKFSDCFPMVKERLNVTQQMMRSWWKDEAVLTEAQTLV